MRELKNIHIFNVEYTILSKGIEYEKVNQWQSINEKL